MNTIRTAVFLVALSLSGGCAVVAPQDSKCAGAPVKKITIVYQRHNKITVAPPVRHVDPGDAIEYKVTGPVPRSFKAEGTSGPGSYGWLDATGSGGPGGVSNIACVPVGQSAGDYEYMIEIDDVGKLDPVVRVD
jgi:hypothetical protein